MSQPGPRRRNATVHKTNRYVLEAQDSDLRRKTVLVLDDFVGPAEDGEGSDQQARIPCSSRLLEIAMGAPVKNRSRIILAILDRNIDGRKPPV